MNISPYGITVCIYSLVWCVRVLSIRVRQAERTLIFSGSLMNQLVEGKRISPQGNPSVREITMKLNEFAASLVKDGMLVLCLSEGEITDYLVTSNALRTLIRRNGDKLSAQVLSTDERIINLNTLPNTLKVLKP